MYADLFSYVLADLVASCTLLRAEVAAHLEDILRRARHGPAARSGAGTTPTSTQAQARPVLTSTRTDSALPRPHRQPPGAVSVGRGSRRSPIAAENAATTYLAPCALAKPGESPGKLGEAMDGEPGKHVGRRLRARRWRAALLWVGALAALTLAAWIATHLALDLAGG
jgi:hypothetical protein